jgi:hypothetical protein
VGILNYPLGSSQQTTRMVLFDTSNFRRISTKVSGLSRHLPTTCLDYFVFPYLKNNVFINRPGTIPEFMQVITDNCNLIDVSTLQRSFENMK